MSVKSLIPSDYTRILMVQEFGMQLLNLDSMLLLGVHRLIRFLRASQKGSAALLVP
jgi:hypothetical protein